MLTFPQQPMLAKPVHALPEAGALEGGCVYEPKFDGYRALLFITEGGCRIQSRRGHDMTTAFADIAEAAEAAFLPGTVLDGELVVWGDDKLDFAALQRRLASGRPRGRPATFVSFDVLCIQGTDIRTWRLQQRREALQLLMTDVPPPIQLTPQTDSRAEAIQWLSDYAANPVGIEGVVIKGRGAKYSSGKREWLKLRIRDTVEVVVGAITGAADHPDRLVLGLYKGSELQVVGGTTDLKPPEQATIAPLLTPAGDKHPWPDEISEGRLGHYGKAKVALTRVEPTLVVEISADCAIEYGRWRHVVKFIRARPDLSPQEIDEAPE
jgi:ATP-dependent DNA ligase